MDHVFCQILFNYHTVKQHMARSEKFEISTCGMSVPVSGWDGGRMSNTFSEVRLTSSPGLEWAGYCCSYYNTEDSPVLL